MEEILAKLVQQAVARAVAPLVQEVRELRAQVEVLQKDAPSLEDDGPITMGEAAKLLRCSKITVSKWMRTGKLKFFIPPDGRQKKTRRSWVEECIQRQAAN